MWTDSEYHKISGCNVLEDIQAKRIRVQTLDNTWAVQYDMLYKNYFYRVELFNFMREMIPFGQLFFPRYYEIKCREVRAIEAEMAQMKGEPFLHLMESNEIPETVKHDRRLFVFD